MGEQLIDVGVSKLEDLEAQCSRLVSQIHSYGGIVQTKHDIIRNNISKENLYLNRSHVAISGAMLVMAAFGMNFDFPFAIESHGSYGPFFVIIAVAGLSFLTIRRKLS